MAYNSAYTGPQIDEAIGAVQDNKEAWSEKEILYVNISGTTADKTNAEIKEARDDGKLVIAMYGSMELLLVDVSTSIAVFATLIMTNRVMVVRFAAGTAMYFALDLESSGNRVTALSATSSDTTYPTAKAVWAAIPHTEAKTDEQTQAVGMDTDGKLWTKPAEAELPAVTSSDDGKFLRVVSGAWALLLFLMQTG